MEPLSGKIKAGNSKAELPAEDIFSVIYVIRHVENPNDLIAVFAEERARHPCLPQQDIGLADRAQARIKQPFGALFPELLHGDPAGGHAVDDEAAFFHVRAADRTVHGCFLLLQNAPAVPRAFPGGLVRLCCLSAI